MSGTSPDTNVKIHTLAALAVDDYFPRDSISEERSLELRHTLDEQIHAAIARVLGPDADIERDEYTIIVSARGCLPEQEPYTVDGIEAARDALRTEITRTVDAHDGPGAEEYGAQEAEAHQATLSMGRDGDVILVGKYAHEARRVL